MSGGVDDIELLEQTALQADEEDGSIHADAGELNRDPLTLSLPEIRCTNFEGSQLQKKAKLEA